MFPWAGPKHAEQALLMARKSMTLLKNSNQVLPLSKDLDCIAVIGPNADDSTMQWANYNGIPAATVTILEGIRAKVPATRIIYHEGCDIAGETVKLLNCLLHSGNCSPN
jgi:beta-glucosidase